MKAKLTEKLIRTLEPTAKLFKVWDTEQAGLFVRVMPSGTKTFAVFVRADGRGTDYTIGKWGALTLAQAREQAKAALGKVATGTDPQQEKKAAKAAREQAKRDADRARKATLGVYLDETYGPWVIRHRKAGAATLARLNACFGAWRDKPMTDINPWLMERWKSDRLKAGRKPATINRDIVALKAALALAVEWDILDAHPMGRKVKPLKLDSKGKVRYLTEAEETRLRRALSDRETRIRTERASGNRWRAERGHELLADLSGLAYVDHLRPIVLLAMNTGLRRGELFNLRWHDINFQTRTLTVQGGGAKSGQTRHVPLNDEARDVLTRWKQRAEDAAGRAADRDERDISNHYVFPAADGGRLTDIKKAFGKLLDDAEIQDFRFHDLRHHFANRLVMAGVDLNTVRDLLGHADLNMTLRYAHLAPEHKAAAVALLNRAAS